MVDVVYNEFGEVGTALAVPEAGAYDIPPARALMRDEKYCDYAVTGIQGLGDAAGALRVQGR